MDPKLSSKAKLVGMSAQCAFASRHDFTRLRRMLEVNTHFNGAAEMLERVEAALKLTTGLDLPVPRTLFQNADMSLGLMWQDFSLLLSSETIMWRFAQTGEPHAVNDAATAGVPVDVLNALAHLARMSAAN